MDRALTEDEHIARLVDAMRANCGPLATGPATAEQLLTAVRQALDAATTPTRRGSTCSGTAPDLDANVHLWDPSATHDPRSVALRTLDALARAATARGNPRVRQDVR